MHPNGRDEAKIGHLGKGTLTIPYTELPPRQDGPFATEWNHYRSVVGELLAAGHEGKWLLLVGEEIVGIWETEAEATVAQEGRGQSMTGLVKQILSREPTFKNGYNRRCRD